MAEINTGGDADGVTVLKEARSESGGQRGVAEEFGPFVLLEVGGEESAFAVATVVHETKEIVDLRWQRRINVTELVDEQKVETGETFQEPFGGAIGMRGAEFLEEILS